MSFPTQSATKGWPRPRSAASRPPPTKDERPYTDDMGNVFANKGEELYKKSLSKKAGLEEKLERARKEKSVKEKGEILARPKILPASRNRRGEDGLSFADYTWKWASEKEERRKRLSQRVREQEEKAIGRPESLMSSHSRKICDKRCPPSVVDDWEAHFVKFLSRRSGGTGRSEEPPEVAAATGRGEGSVAKSAEACERLHDAAVALQEKKRIAELIRQREFDFDPQTGQQMFVPSTRSPPGAMSPEDFERRLKAGREMSMRVAERVSEEESERIRLECTFSPHINRKSALLAQRNRRPLYSPPSARTSPKPPKSSKADDSVSVSSSMMSRDDAFDDFLQRSAQMAQSALVKKSVLEEGIISKEMESCSFAPRVCPQSERILRKARSQRTSPEKMTHGASDDSLLGWHFLQSNTQEDAPSLYDRTMARLSQRSRNLGTLRRHLEEASMKECTFQPLTTDSFIRHTARDVARPPTGHSGTNPDQAEAAASEEILSVQKDLSSIESFLVSRGGTSVSAAPPPSLPSNSVYGEEYMEISRSSLSGAEPSAVSADSFSQREETIPSHPRDQSVASAGVAVGVAEVERNHQEPFQTLDDVRSDMQSVMKEWEELQLDIEADGRGRRAVS